MLISYQSSSVIEDAKAANYAEFSCKFVRVLIGLDIPAASFILCKFSYVIAYNLFTIFLASY